jgi:hypothetical protein
MVESGQTKRSLDHFVICVRHIETAAEAYRRMGFRVMPVMEHVEIGTSNVIVQFQDTYLELIGDFDHCRSSTINDNMRPWLDVGSDIFWQTSCTSQRLEDEIEPLRAEGLHPQPILSARRRVRLTEGGWDETDSRSFYTYNDRNIHASIFMSDHRKPQAIWMPGWQCHPNTTQRVIGISYIADDVNGDVDYATIMIGGAPASRSADRVAFHTPRGEFFEIVSSAAAPLLLPGARPLEPGIAARGAAFTIAVTSLEHCRWALRDGGVPHVQTGETIIVPASHSCGMSIIFKQV